MGYIFFRRQCR